MKALLLFSLILSIFYLTPLQGEETDLLLKHNLARAQPGDYIVTVQNKNYTFLLVKNKQNELLNIEEITMPKSRVTDPSFSWKAWLENGAPGNTSWIMYTIHLPSGTMQQVYSFTKSEWLPQSQNILSTLLNLRLKQIPDQERKRIGPPSASDHLDRRPYWQPKMVVDGKVVQNVAFQAWRTYWPKDGSELSGKFIEVYLPQEGEKYPSYFPYWLQVKGAVGNARVRIIDSGSNAKSPSFQQ